MPRDASIRSCGEPIARPAASRGNAPTREDRHGHLVYRAGGAWGFHYDDDANLPDEAGYHFADERFVVGEYVSINERGKMHNLSRDDGVAPLAPSDPFRRPLDE